MRTRTHSDHIEYGTSATPHWRNPAMPRSRYERHTSGRNTIASASRVKIVSAAAATVRPRLWSCAYR